MSYASKAQNGPAHPKVHIIISKRTKIYQKGDKSKNDKNKITGSFTVSVDRF